MKLKNLKNAPIEIASTLASNETIILNKNENIEMKLKELKWLD